MDNANAGKKDPIRGRYFDPLDGAELATNIGFFVAGILSLAVLMLDRAAYPQTYATIQVSFLIAVIFTFAISMSVRLYFGPRAQEARLGDFLSTAYGVRIVAEGTEGYYNNSAQEPVVRIAAQTLENTHFSKEIARRMCWRERGALAIYAAFWLVAFANRNTDLDVLLIASQVVFSEQVLSRFFRTEWLRERSEAVFAQLYRQLQARGQDALASATILGELLAYETAKANAGIKLSTALFEKRNAELTAEWEVIRKQLNL